MSECSFLAVIFKTSAESHSPKILCVRPKKIKQAFDNIKGSSIACLSQRQVLQTKIMCCYAFKNEPIEGKFK